MKSKLISNLFFLLILIFWIGGATKFLDNNEFLLWSFIISFLFFISKKKRINTGLIYIILYFGLINFLSWLFFHGNFSTETFIGYILRLVMAYFWISYFGWSFFEKYRKYVFIVALIGLPFYIIQIFDIDFFIKQFSNLNLSSEERVGVRYWNFIIYTAHQAQYAGITRNSGFAIEPGQYGYLIGFATILEIINSRFNFNYRTIVLIIIGLSTFSTSYFLTLALTLLFYQLNTLNKTKFLFFKVSIVLFLIFNLVTSNVVTEKVSFTLYENEAIMQRASSHYTTGGILNRWGMFQIGLENFINYPLGYGINTAGLQKDDLGDILTGPNTFAWLSNIWGIAFLIVLPIALIKFIKLLLPDILSFSIIVFIAIWIVWLNTAVQSKDYLFFIIVLTGLLKILPSKETI